MCFRSHRLVSTAFSTALLVFASQSFAFAQINPKIETTIGSGSNISYFVLDFLSGPAPQSYAFAYRYDGTKTGGDLIAALATNAPTFRVEFQQFSFGRLYDGFGYSDKFIKAPAFPATSFWSYWNGTNGQDWTSPQEFGADGRTLVNGSWDGFSYALNGVAVAPRTPLAVTAAAPEPGSLTLLAVAAISGAGIVVRRRRRIVGK
jgi:hypothetical protein